MLTDDQLNEEMALTIEFKDVTGSGDTYKMTAFASGRIEGLKQLLDIAYLAPRQDVHAVVINYIPDLLRQHRPPTEQGVFDLGFKVATCEGGAYVLSDYRFLADEWTRYVCADVEALYGQMRAWTERQIERHRKYRARKGEESAAHTAFERVFTEATHIASGARSED